MTLYRKAAAALIAALIIALSLAARAELVAVKPYDPENPGYLMPAHLYAEAALLVDRDTGEVMFSKNSKVRMFPASTTKIMTLLLGIESGIALDEQVTIPAEASDVPQGSSVIPIKPGDVMSFRDLLYSFMATSGNDGANAVAVLVDGSIEAFVEHMNARAEELGMTGTHFVNAHGYHDSDHYTTAEDLATLSRYAMENETFRDAVAQPTWTITVTRGGVTKSAEVVSRNTLLQSNEKYYYPACNGIKTGHHAKAGWCFVGSAERDGMRLICVVLNCPGEMDKWYDAAKLFEYGFTRYRDVPGAEILEHAAPRFNTVEVEGAAKGDGTLELRLYDIEDGGSTVKLLDGSEAALDRQAEQLAETAQITWVRDPVAPVAAGEILANIHCAMPDGGEVKAILFSSRDVAVAPTEAPAEPTEAPEPEATREAGDPQGRVGVGGAVAVIAVLCALLAVCGVAVARALSEARRKRARRRKRRKGTKRPS